MSRALKLALQGAVSVGLIYLVLRAVDTRELGARIAGAELPLLGAVMALSLAVLLLQNGRWRAVLGAAGPLPGLATTLRIVAIGHFFNQALPSSVGGDVMRVWFSVRAGIGVRVATHSVLVDRLVSVAALLLSVGLALPWLLGLLADPKARWAIVAIVPCGIIGLATLMLMDRMPARLRRWRAVREMAAFSGFLRAVMLTPRVMGAALFWALLAFGTLGLMVQLLFLSIGERVALFHCIMLLLPVMLVMAVPVSIAGWGLREGAMVVAFGFVGVAPASALAMSVLMGLVQLATGIPGSVLWWSAGHPRQAAGTVVAVPEPGSGPP